MAVGLFAAACRVMESYLDTTHSDSWLLGTALLGSYLVDRFRSRFGKLAGVLILIASFWFKQHGALFALGGVLFLTWREGWRRSASYWLALVLFGPVLYIFGGLRLFGPYFHYYTWQIPHRWSIYSPDAVGRFLVFTAQSYAVLTFAGALSVFYGFRRHRETVNIWQFQFIFAVLTGVMGLLDAGNVNNVFIPVGVWLILGGTMGLFEFSHHWKGSAPFYQLAPFASFAALLYNPFEVICSPRAKVSYGDLLSYVGSIEGQVYAPWIGELPGDYHFIPGAHWVALDDMVGAGHLNYLPAVCKILDPAIHPRGPAYLLSNRNFDEISQHFLNCLRSYYVLETDLGTRFEPLQSLPRRWSHRYPRYLYRYAPEEAKAREATSGRFASP